MKTQPSARCKRNEDTLDFSQRHENSTPRGPTVAPNSAD